MNAPTPHEQQFIVAIILSGGAGRRFDGLDKGLQEYKNKPLIEHVIDALKPQVESFILCVNRNQERYQKYGYPLVEDLNLGEENGGETQPREPSILASSSREFPLGGALVDGFRYQGSNNGGHIYQGPIYQGPIYQGPIYQGPMAGVNAAAIFLENSSIIGDASHVLLSSCDSPSLPSNFVATLLSHLKQSGKSIAVAHDGERKQNLHSLIKVDELFSLKKYYQSGGRAMHRWYEKTGYVEVDFSAQSEAFLNINTRQQLS